jgi:putative glutamine amidotransferase
LRRVKQKCGEIVDRIDRISGEEKAMSAARPSSRPETRPLIGVLCCNRMIDQRRAQTVATRFVAPLAAVSAASALLVPALPDALDGARLGGMFDALLLTGSCSDVAGDRYGADPAAASGPLDRDRDEVAFRLASGMIAAGRPVFGICRGMQELNVLFGGTLSDAPGAAGHHRDAEEGASLAALFDHRHAVEVAGGGVLDAAIGTGAHWVNSVHRQGVERLGDGLRVEARAPDRLIEAISAPGCGAPVLGVQWHPEWDVDDNDDSRAFFALLGRAARGHGIVLAA